MKHVPVLALLAALCLPSAVVAESASLTTRVLSFGSAHKLTIQAAEACRQQGYQVTASVVDRGGNLLALVRDPLAGTHTIEVSRLKAVTSASFQTATIEMQDGFQGLRHAPDVLLIGGGVPVQIGGQFYGAVGVSGAPAKKVTGDVDDECARAGIAAIREDIEFGD
ncbi:GlcG/HbpS family heme-binding protein [Sulfuriflexus sp.]|uniref:GlcG/HbpS family heme-binding protein n=1 Tax=Sulfuriflexus sp. TaxID=2015443 RepID=UPI0028CBEBCA|nr:heme-binding protein [Sulfuriflexus sp.]MDT8405157.1 heme-binding protein [Sulfuriflexus sp.]